MPLRGLGPTSPHNDPQYVKATHQLREERARRLARMAPWERAIVLAGAPLLLVGVVLAVTWLLG